MTSTYPGALDSLTNHDGTDLQTDHVDQHNDANDAIEAIEATLGTDPQGAESTVADRIAALEGGGGGATPTFDQTLVYMSGADNISVAIPSSAVAGDLLIAFLPASFGADIPSGWVALINTTGLSYINHSLFTKVASSGDITAGSFTFTFQGSDDGEAILVSVHGWTQITGFADNRSENAYALSTNALSPYSAGMKVNDLALYMVGSRSPTDPFTFDKGTLVQQRDADANQSSALYAGTHTLGGPIIATATSSVTVEAALAVCVVTVSG